MTITKAQVIREIELAEAAAKVVQNIKQQFALQECPFKVGEETVCHGFAHRGKRMRVTRVTPSSVLGSNWAVCGLVMKANGEPGAQEARFHHLQYELNMASRSKKEL